MLAAWQRRWERRAQLVRQAMTAADTILVEGAESPEELEFLTAEVAQEFVKKLWMDRKTHLLKRDLSDDQERQTALGDSIR